MAEDVTVFELKGRIGDYFTDLTREDGWRAMRIARTEASYAWDRAAQLGYSELGVEKIDVVGCDDDEGDCNAQDVPVEDIDTLNFHPNHSGTCIPVAK